MQSYNLIESFYILDFDRTLARTDDLRELYEGVIETLTPVTVAEIHKARDRIKSSFDVARYVREQLEKELPEAEINETMSVVREMFIKKARMQDFLEPYAKELLESLQMHSLPYGILTSGGKEWQQTKIEAARLAAIPHLIINTTKKGPLIASWQQPDGTFLLPDELSGNTKMVAKLLIFLDDKTVSFQDIPLNVKGFRIISVTAKEPFEPELPLPPNVKEVNGLEEAMKCLF
jgi:hypothetical protein